MLMKASELATGGWPEERSSLREAAKVVVTCNLPEPGRSSPFKPARTAAPRAPAAPAQIVPAPIRCTRTQPASTQNPSSQPQKFAEPLNCQSALNSGG